MTRFPKTFNPPEELDGLRVLLPILLVMTLGDICFLWNSYSFSVGDDFMAAFMTASTMAGIVGLPMLAAWALGAALDHSGQGRASAALLILCGFAIAAVVVLVVFVTVLRLGTASVTEGASDVVSASSASFGGMVEARQGSSGGADASGLLVALMTVLLASTAVLSFSRMLIDCCMTLREPMIDSYRRRTAPKRLAQIDAMLAGIEACSVERRRSDDKRLRNAAEENAAKVAAEIVVDLEKEVSIASEDPASWQVAMGGESLDKGADSQEGQTGQPESDVIGDEAGAIGIPDAGKASNRKAA